MPLRIFIADHDEIIRQLLSAVISHQPGWEICGEAAVGSETVEQVTKLKPDVILMGFGLSDPGGVEAAHKIIQNDPTQKIIALGVSDGVSAARAAFDAGALGYIFKATAARDVVVAIRALQEGRTFFTRRIAESILHTFLPVGESEGSKPQRTEHDRIALNLLTREATTNFSVHPDKKAFPSSLKYLLTTAIVGVLVTLIWVNFHDTLEQRFPFIHKMLVDAGLRTVPLTTYEGNPNTKVWIDLRTALYYCPGSQPYGKTAKGRFANQQDALLDHFEPATRKACD